MILKSSIRLFEIFVFFFYSFILSLFTYISREVNWSFAFCTKKNLMIKQKNHGDNELRNSPSWIQTRNTDHQKNEWPSVKLEIFESFLRQSKSQRKNKLTRSTYRRYQSYTKKILLTRFSNIFSGELKKATRSRFEEEKTLI